LLYLGGDDQEEAIADAFSWLFWDQAGDRNPFFPSTLMTTDYADIA
jgi:hypothetical protein